MNFIIRGDHLEVTDALKEYTIKKLSRLDKYFDAPDTEAHVTMRVIRGVHRVEVTIPFPGLLLRAEEESEDMYASVDLVLEKLERQIRKHKTKLNRKWRQDASLRAQVTFKDDHQEEEEEFKIVKTKRFHMKPMNPEEAALQMDMLGHNFFVFSNAETDEMNVIYKRKDGTYGLIEPE